MIRHLHPTDTPALLPFKQRTGPDEAWSNKRVFSQGRGRFPLFKYSSIALSPRAWQSCWVLTKRASVQAVVRAGVRSGPLAWDVNGLFVARRDPDIAMMALEQLAFPAGASGARRIFLRLRSDSEIFDAARAAGYRPAYSETVFGAGSAHDVMKAIDSNVPGDLVELDQEHEHAAYRLYCAAVPIDARSRIGQTLDEWKSAREPLPRKSREYAIADPDSERLHATIRVANTSGTRSVSITRSADAKCTLNSLLAIALSSSDDGPVAVKVASYDAGIGDALTGFGFTAGDSYDVMIKTLAVSVKQTAHGYATVER